MKKYIIILAVALFGCTPEDNSCECTGQFQRDDQTYFYKHNMEIDCITGEPEQLIDYKEKGVFVKCVTIDY